MTELSYGRDVLGVAERSKRLEWIVTNGIGGYAAGTAAGILTRRYHGLLVAALEPPVGRTFLLAKLAERIEIDGTFHDLDTNRWADGALAPQGLVHLESFRLEAGVPAWTWAIADARLEKRVWMEHGENTTYVQYRLAAARAPVTLALRALVDHRDAHHVTSRGDALARIEPATGGLKIQMRDDATPLWLLAPGASIEPRHDWYLGFALALEEERGLEPREDLLCAAELTVTLAPGDTFTLIASTRHDAGARGGALGLATALARRHAHEKSLMAMWAAAFPRAARAAPRWIEQLVLAADAFVVERAVNSDLNGRSIIAGYPWFADWGRDTMIALPGLTLATGRPEIARAVIATFARHLDQGMLPNRFPDHGHAPEYTSADAALWFFQAVRATFEATGDEAWLAQLYPALEEIGAWMETGTRHGIGIDPADGLVRIGENDRVALTWMDARVDGRAVTPRRGKPVEINALWHGALVAMAGFATRLKRPAEPYELLARQVERSFERFWNAEAGCLYDVID